MLNDVCRVCLNSVSLKSIFRKQEYIMFSTMLMAIANVKIHPDDGLPSFICSECSTKLRECYKFKRKCENSDIKLRLLAEFDNTDVNTGPNISCLNTSKTDGHDDDSDFGDNSEDNSLSICLKHPISIPSVETRDSTEGRGEARASPHEEGVQSSLHHVNGDDKKLTECKIKKKIGKKRTLVKQQCSICGKVLSCRYRLQAHLRTHTGEKPFVCIHCNKKFSHEETLKVHLRVHTGEKPLRCTICGQLFRQSSGLTIHYRKHTAVLPYKCTLCTSQFRTASHLQYHIRRHTGEKNYECDTCGRAFINGSILKQHSLTHSGEKRFVCSVCGSRFTRGSQLKRHATKYCGNKPYACGLCPSKFNLKMDLDKHLKKHNVTPGTFGTVKDDTTLKA